MGRRKVPTTEIPVPEREKKEDKKKKGLAAC